MIGERENILNETKYGTLNMRSYNIDGNDINTFYDANETLIFVLDNTISPSKPNVLLVINPMGDKKWDEILSGEYNVDLETIRPKQDNKYQKLDIEYSGLSVYENLINADIAGDDLSEHLIQLNILRDSAARHSAMMRLNVANETISKTNVTIVKTKETILRLQERIKTLRAKLSAQKKEIGKVPTKQSASKILKLEAQIEASNEKLKRAKKRLESAQKRLEIATVDAELASDLLNQPALEIEKQSVKSKPIMVAPRYELQNTDAEDAAEDNVEEDFEDDDDVESDVKPLFDEDPNIINEDIAFKPITFDAPALNVNNSASVPETVFDSEYVSKEESTNDVEIPEYVPNTEESKPVLESMTPVSTEEYTEQPEESVESKPVLESMVPVKTEEPVIEQPAINVYPVENIATPQQPNVTMEAKPVPPVPPVPPIMPLQNNTPIVNTPEQSKSKTSFAYYFLLGVLIILSIFTLWLYQKQMGVTSPTLTAIVSEKVETGVEESRVNNEIVESVKATEPDDIIEDEQHDEAEQGLTEDDTESNDGFEATEDVAPVVMDAVPSRITSSGGFVENEMVDEETNSVVNKPEYVTGPRHDEMFVAEQDYSETGINQDDDIDFYEEEFYEE